MRSRIIKISVCCAVIGVIVILPIGLRFWHIFAYARERTVGRDLIESLRDRRPATVSVETWRNATGWACTAYCNICFSEEEVTFDELVRFTHDTTVKLTKDVNLDTIDWLWIRLGQTGPHGKQYVARHEPDYRDLVYGIPLDATSPQANK